MNEKIASAEALLTANAELRAALDVALQENDGWREFAKAAQQREQLLQAQYDEARKATAEFDRMRLLACEEAARLAPIARESYRLQADLIFLRAECDGTKAREAQLRGRVLAWEDCYDRLAGAFELHMDILDCKQALSDLAGSYYDVLLGDLASENAALKARGE